MPTTIARAGMTAAGLSLASLGLVPLIGGLAHAADRQFPPAPCKTVTTQQVDKLLHVDATTVLKKKVTIEDAGTSRQADTCRYRSDPHVLLIRTSLSQASIPGPFMSYDRPKLGFGGAILVSTTKTFPETVAIYERKDVYFADTYNAILPHKGKRLLNFAYKQSLAFKKASS